MHCPADTRLASMTGGGPVVCPRLDAGLAAAAEAGRRVLALSQVVPRLRRQPGADRAGDGQRGNRRSSWRASSALAPALAIRARAASRLLARPAKTEATPGLHLRRDPVPSRACCTPPQE